MKLAVSKSKLTGEISVPGSKSHTIRAVAIAAMANGASIIKSPLVSSDTISAISTASALGAWIKRGDDSVWKITGTGGHLLEPANCLDLGNSGTSLRIFTALASLADFSVSFDGDASLRTRKMAPLLSALQNLGAKCESTDGLCPVAVQGPLQGGETDVDGTTSQYLSALLLAAPLCKQDTMLRVEHLNEQPYVQITLDWLTSQGIHFESDSRFSLFTVAGGQTYHPFTRKIPGDFSSAAFPVVAGVLTGGGVIVKNLDFTDNQGDKAIFSYLEAMGAKITIKNDHAVIKPAKKLKALEIDMNATPDLLPIMAVAATAADGITVLKNVPQARIKETDRINCMSSELEKMGIVVEQFEDGMAITGGKLHSANVESYKDHRIAMALSIAGMTTSDDGTTIINDADSIEVTYPSFIDDFRVLGAEFYTNANN